MDQFSSAWYYHRGGKAGKPALPNQGNVRQQDKKKLWNWYNTYQTLGKCLEDTAKERLHADEWAALAAITKDMTADQLSEEQVRHRLMVRALAARLDISLSHIAACYLTGTPSGKFWRGSKAVAALLHGGGTRMLSLCVTAAVPCGRHR